MAIIVYCHTHTDSGRKYVGQTCVGMDRRWRLHVQQALSKRGKSRCRAFAEAIRKFGPDAFTHEVLEEVDSHKALNAAEALWIARLGTIYPDGFNLTDGRGGMHDSIRARMSASATERAARLTQEARRAIGSRLRAAQTEETHRKRAAALSSDERSRLTRAYMASLTAEQRLELTMSAREACRRMSPEQFRDRAMRAVAGWTPETRKASIAKRLASSTPEQRSASARKSWASRTPEQRAKAAAKTVANMPRERLSAWCRAWQASRTRDEREASSRRASETKRRAAGLNALPLDEIRALFTDGLSLREIARRHATTHHTIKRIVTQAGCETILAKIRPELERRHVAIMEIG